MPIWKKVLSLIFVNLIYAFEPILAQITSHQKVLSGEFFLGLSSIILVLGLYAILWQQILKYIELSIAYMFKGTSLIFVLVLSVILLGDTITTTNIIGTILIIGGIALFAKS